MINISRFNKIYNYKIFILFHFLFSSTTCKRGSQKIKIFTNMIYDMIYDIDRVNRTYNCGKKYGQSKNNGIANLDN